MTIRQPGVPRPEPRPSNYPSVWFERGLRRSIRCALDTWAGTARLLAVVAGLIVIAAASAWVFNVHIDIGPFHFYRS